MREYYEVGKAYLLSTCPFLYLAAKNNAPAQEIDNLLHSSIRQAAHVVPADESNQRVDDYLDRTNHVFVPEQTEET